MAKKKDKLAESEETKNTEETTTVVEETEENSTESEETTEEETDPVEEKQDVKKETEAPKKKEWKYAFKPSDNVEIWSTGKAMHMKKKGKKYNVSGAIAANLVEKGAASLKEIKPD